MAGEDGLDVVRQDRRAVSDVNAGASSSASGTRSCSSPLEPCNKTSGALVRSVPGIKWCIWAGAAIGDFGGFGERRIDVIP